VTEKPVSCYQHAPSLPHLPSVHTQSLTHVHTCNPRCSHSHTHTHLTSSPSQNPPSQSPPQTPFPDRPAA
jgi:hypothetical protein